jgi:hypothetical protein
MDIQLVRTSALSFFDREEIYLLLCTYFAGVQRDRFDNHLNQANWVMLIREIDSGVLRGFSSFHLYETWFNGEPIAVIQSRDTAVDPCGWPNSVLPRAWMTVAKLLKREYRHRSLYWLLLCSNYRTFRSSATLWQQFYPKDDRAIAEGSSGSDLATCWPTLVQTLLEPCDDVIYNADRNIATLAHGWQLREPLQRIPPPRAKDPDVRFFADRNPGHGQGQRLVCLTEIHPGNLTIAGRRLWASEALTVHCTEEKLLSGDGLSSLSRELLGATALVV